ncbi:S9 family peptidase [Olivibacter sitiensis]|uniref:S9 family peptidase n=1 Tax=Olivibacter sitiensis TaxID=376470 RepID=UPI000425C724|nr:S9 family peptidase [Olivibacter sitiensis]
MNLSLKIGAVIGFLFMGSELLGQSVERFRPSHQEMVERYARAMELDSLSKDIVYKYTVDAHWAADGNSFWYENKLMGNTSEYIEIQAATGKRSTLVSAPRQDELQQGPRPRRRRQQTDFVHGSQSPDGQWEAFMEKGNLFVKGTASGQVKQLTKDGTEADPYGYMVWSPNGKYLAGYKVHPVKDSLVYYILTAEPGTTRGQLRSQPYKQPGDPFTSYEPHVFLVEEGKALKVDAELVDFGQAPEFHWRSDDARYFFYEKFDRGHQRFRLMQVDAQTGKAVAMVDEQTKTFIYHDRQLAYYPKGTNWYIRSSEKDGWRHLYLVDLATGQEKAITSGSWVVRDVDSIDVVGKKIWFSASGMHEGEDPYHVHHYRIGLDGKGLLALTPESANHTVTFSPDKKYFIDNYSTVNTPPRTALRRASDGKEITLLEEADVTDYKRLGFQAPEVFVAKARDGLTDIWGIVSKPSDYDPAKKYPVLENIYAGPHDSFVPKSFVPYSEMQSLAELGFIVVMIDGMGTANRSKAFHDLCWQNLEDAGLEDRELWIKALARKYPYVDAERVGIYGTSAGGQNTVTALLHHGDFYKAGVAACGCYDNRVDKQWWNEQWMGYPVGKHYEEQSNVTNAHLLQGNLMLIVGEADTNVPPESSYRVADALIKAGKLFDFLPVPGMGHSDGGPYGRIKKREFFVKYLLEVEPPNWNQGEVSFRGEMGRERWFFR